MDLIIILLIIGLPIIAQIKVTHNYKKYSDIKNNISLTGKEVAEKILNANGLSNIAVNRINGELSDHYDPRNMIINLSNDIYSSNSISAAAVAAHECGHAIQDKEQYSFMKIRTAMVPIVNFTSKAATIILYIGIILSFLDLINLAIILLLCGLIFQLVTLPVEFDASRRGKIELKKLGIIDTKGTNKVLKAAAFTYVASFLATALQITRLFLATRKRN